jgi:Arc/MetJ-type ribon-helix-helix transcriptional regulator
MTSTDERSITLPAPLVEEVERRCERGDFDSPDEYVTFVVRSVLTRLEEPDDEAPQDVDEEIRTRLESLGYVE